MKTTCLALVLALAACNAHAAPLSRELAGLAFLLGAWSSGDGKIADTGGTSAGSSVITAEAGGAVLLRRDHTNLFDAGGKPAGGFDQIMMIYAEGGAIHADYADGTHIIHYTSASIDPGHAVTFSSAASGRAPVFKLTYMLHSPRNLSVTFAMVPPGGTTPRPIAVGTLQRRP